MVLKLGGYFEGCKTGPPEVQFATSSWTNQTRPNHVTYSCENSFILHGAGAVTCELGAWSQDVTYCGK